MKKYSIKPYEQGFDKEQAHIGFEVANLWLWPLAHDEQDLKHIHTQPDFDPETSLYCFEGNKMVGFISMSLPSPAATDKSRAVLFIPRCLPGSEETSDLLIEKSLEVLRKRGVRKVEIQISTMFKNNSAWLEVWGCLNKCNLTMPGKWSAGDLPQSISPVFCACACASMLNHSSSRRAVLSAMAVSRILTAGFNRVYSSGTTLNSAHSNADCNDWSRLSIRNTPALHQMQCGASVCNHA